MSECLFLSADGAADGQKKTRVGIALRMADSGDSQVGYFYCESGMALLFGASPQAGAVVLHRHSRFTVLDVGVAETAIKNGRNFKILEEPVASEKYGVGFRKNDIALRDAVQKALEEIATQKLPDLNANDVEAAKKIIAGTARSMGIEVEAN